MASILPSLDKVVEQTNRFPQNSGEVRACIDKHLIPFDKVEIQLAYSALSSLAALDIWRTNEHKSTSLNELTEFEIKNINDTLASISNTLRLLENTIRQQQSTKDRINQTIIESNDQILDYVKSIESVLLKNHKIYTLHLNVDTIKKNLTNTPDVNIIINKLDRTKKELTDLEGQLKNTKAAVNRLSVDVLARGEIAVLGNVLQNQRRMSKIWLTTLIITLLSVFYIIIWLATPYHPLFGWGPFSPTPPANASPAVIVFYSISKLLVGAFAFGGLIMVARLYQTYLHNLVVNEQRLVASDSFKQLNTVLADAAPEVRTKLVEVASKAILEHSSSGFLPSGTNEFTGLIQPLLDAAKKAK